MQVSKQAQHILHILKKSIDHLLYCAHNQYNRDQHRAFSLQERMTMPPRNK